MKSLSFFLFVSTVLASQSAAATIDEIRKAWQHNASVVDAAQFEWTLTETTYSDFSEDGPGDKKRPEPVVTTKNVKFAFRGTTRRRYEHKGTEFDSTTGDVVPASVLRTAVDQECRQLLRGEANNGAPMGMVLQTFDSTVTTLLHPVFWAFSKRPVTRRQWSLDDFTVSDDVLVADGRPCRILRETLSPRKKNQWILWVDTERHYHIVRATRQNVKRDYSILDYSIQYSETPAGVWYPDEWDITVFQTREVPLLGMHVVVDHVVLNPTLGDDHFELVFPVGTHVTSVNGDGKVVEKYIQRKDGEKRQITPREEGLSYKTLLETETEELLDRGMVGRRWLILLNVAVLVVVVIVWLVRRHRQAEQ